MGLLKILYQDEWLAAIDKPTALLVHQTVRYSLVEARPLTGRTHQLRRHFKHVSHPIIGDTSHGDGRHNRLFRDEFRIQRLILHAQSLSFQHPHTGEPVEVKASLPDEFA